MPELPEVETVKKTLLKLIKDKEVESVEVCCEKMIKNVDVKLFESQLIGQSFKNIRRKGKYLLLDLNKNTIVSHLRMEGKYNFYNEITMPTKHDHIIYRFTDNTMLCYNDTRKFGTIELVGLKGEMELNSVKKLGLEPGDEKLTIKYLGIKAKRKTVTIKQFLLDQTVITGLGNIYVDEVLFLSGINPCIRVCNIDEIQFQKIINQSKEVITKAIQLGGTSVHSFSVSGNVTGKFQNELNVYNRNGEKCFYCNEEIKKIKLGGRGTHYCPNCQGEK